MSSETEPLTIPLDKHLEVLAEVRPKIRRLQAEVLALRENLDEAHEEANVQRARAEKAERELGNAPGEVIQLRCEVERLEGHLLHVLREITGDQDAKPEDYPDEDEASLANDLRMDWKRLQGEAEELRTILAQARAERDEFMREAGIQRDTKETRGMMLTVSQDETERARELLRQARTERDNHAQSVEGLGKANAELRAQVTDSLRTKVEKLRERLKDSDTHRKRWYQRAVDAEVLAEKLATELAEWKSWGERQ